MNEPITSESDENKALIRMWVTLALPVQFMKKGRTWESIDFEDATPAQIQVEVDFWFLDDAGTGYPFVYRLRPDHE